MGVLLGFQTNSEQTILPVQLEAGPGVSGSNDDTGFSVRSLFSASILLILLARMGVISSSYLSNKRRYAVVFCFVIAAIVTPPDVISQIGLALPLFVLYECSIWLAHFFEKSQTFEGTWEATDISKTYDLPDRGCPETDFNGQ